MFLFFLPFRSSLYFRYLSVFSLCLPFPLDLCLYVNVSVFLFLRVSFCLSFSFRFFLYLFLSVSFCCYLSLFLALFFFLGDWTGMNAEDDGPCLTNGAQRIPFGLNNSGPSWFSGFEIPKRTLPVSSLCCASRECRYSPFINRVTEMETDWRERHE